jgi:hypothetical protein
MFDLPAACAEGLSARRADGSITVTDGKQPVLRYRFGDAPFKPYIKTLYSPAGVQVLRDSPHDHIHHRGAMFALFVDGVDFWTERPASGKQQSVEIVGLSSAVKENLAQANWTEKLRWIAPEAKRPLVVETRAIEVFRGESIGATLVDWRSLLAAGPGREVITITGTHYDGLGLRFIESMDDTGEFLYAAGEPGPVVRGAERVTRSRWAAYTAPADGKGVTVALFAHPSNPRAPAGMFTMPRHFAYLSATPNVWKNPMEVKQGEPVALHYAIALWDGKTPREAIESLYQQWLKLVGDE